MRWFRFYTEALNDPKVQRLPAKTFRTWINILCISADREGELWGTLPPVSDLAYQLRMTEKATTELLDTLIAIGLIDRNGESVSLHNWDKWQYRSDDVTARTRRSREQHGNVRGNSATAFGGTPPETETETETETAVRF